MAAIYEHKSRGYQIVYNLFFPDGSKSNPKYRFRQTKTEANDLYRECEILERGGRRGDLSPKEIIAARHQNLVTEEESRKLAGGKAIEPYNLDKVYNLYEISSSVANTPYGHIVNMRRARYWKEWLKTRPLSILQVSDIENYVNQRKIGSVAFENQKTHYTKRGVSPKTIRNELEVLRSMIDKAVETGMVETNVAREVDVPVKNKKMRRSLYLDELQRYFAAAEANRHLCHGYAYEMSFAFLYTGFRRSEMAFAEWTDYRPESMQIVVEAKEIDGQVVFTPKSGEAEIIDLPEKLCIMFNCMEHKGRFIFGGDTTIPPARFYKTVKTICSRAGLDPSLTLHHFRHTYTSWLLKETGGDIKYVQGQARHSDQRTTQLYAHSTQIESRIKEVDFGERNLTEGFGQSLVTKITRQHKIRTIKEKPA